MDELKNRETPIRMLLGGGIGSGKSAAGQILEQFGAMVIEGDRLGHTVLESDGEAFGAVAERWPSVVVDGRIDRGALAVIVFANPEPLTELEALTHPAIIRRIGKIASSTDDLIVEIPIILDVPGAWTKVFVDVNEDLRVVRAVERGSSEEDVRQRMVSQPSREEWVEWSDVVIENNGSTRDLIQQIDALWYGLRTTDDGLRL